MNTLAKSNSTKFWICCSVALMLLGALPAAAQVSGAIFTTNGAGQTVDQNLYPNKADVYLSGGPNNCKSGSGLTDGTYNFQVTTPNGIVLSEDDISNRQFTSSGGFVTGYSSPAG